MNSQRNRTLKLAVSAVIAALYAALTIALAPISYGPLQFRVSEALTVIPFLIPGTVWGLFIGCILANLYTGSVLDSSSVPWQRSWRPCSRPASAGRATP